MQTMNSGGGEGGFIEHSPTTSTTSTPSTPPLPQPPPAPIPPPPQPTPALAPKWKNPTNETQNSCWWHLDPRQAGKLRKDYLDKSSKESLNYMLPKWNFQDLPWWKAQDELEIQLFRHMKPNSPPCAWVVSPLTALDPGRLSPEKKLFTSLTLTDMKREEQGQ